MQPVAPAVVFPTRLQQIWQEDQHSGPTRYVPPGEVPFQAVESEEVNSVLLGFGHCYTAVTERVWVWVE